MRTFIHRTLFLCLLAVCLLSAAAAAGTDPVLTVNGQTEDVYLEFNEAPLIRVTVPEGATAVILEGTRIRLSDGSQAPQDDPKEWGNCYDRSDLMPIIEESGMKFFDSGTWRVTAKYITDDYEDGTDPGQGDFVWTTLASMNVSVDPFLARLDAPQVTVSPDSVPRGGFITVSLSNFQHKNEWYWYETERWNEDGDEGGWEYMEQVNVRLREGTSESFSVPTADLEPGSYRLWFCTEAVRYEDAGTYVFFSVTENSAFRDGITLSVQTAPVNIPVAMNLYAAGADSLEVRTTLDEDPYWWEDPFTLEGSAGTWQTSFDRPGTYRLTLTAYEGGNSRSAGTAVLTVTGNEYLADPDFSGLPGKVEPGQGLTGTLLLDSRTEEYFISLYRCRDDGDQTLLFQAHHEVSARDAVSVSLPALLFDRDGVCRLHVHAYASGIESSCGDYRFVRAESSAGVTLTVNGGTDSVTVNASSGALIEVTAPGATAVRLLVDNDWQYLSGPGPFSYYRIFEGGDSAVTAQITAAEPVWLEDGFDWSGFRWEDLEWGACSGTVKVHASQANGRLDLPDVTLDNEAAARGGVLTGSVAGQDRGEHYHAAVMRIYTDGQGAPRSEDLFEVSLDRNNAFSVPILSLTPGTYYLKVNASAEGWKSAERSVPFTVTDGSFSPTEPVLYTQGRTVLTSEDICFYAYAENADRMTMDVSLNGNPYWNNHYEDGGDFNAWIWSSADAGTYTFTLEAWQGQESLGTATVTLTVEAPDGSLETPAVMNVPAVMTVSTALSGSFTAVENAEHYYVKLVYRGDSDEWEDLLDLNPSANQTGTIDLSFPAACFSRPGIYQLEINAAAVGRNGSHLTLNILAVEEGLQQSLDLTVNGGSADGILLYQNASVTVTAPAGVTAVRLHCASEDRWDTRAYEEGGVTWDWFFHSGGNETLIAQGTTDACVTEWLNDPGHNGMEDFDWSQVSWTLTSAETVVPVIQYGVMDDPTVTFPQGAQVGRGELLTVQVEAVEHAYSFGVRIEKTGSADGNPVLDFNYLMFETTLLRLPTDVMGPGDYTVYIEPRCYGWYGSTVGYPFTVTESASWTGDAVFRVDVQNVLTGDYAPVSVYAPGAAEVRVTMDENEIFHESGESVTSYFMSRREGEYALTAWALFPDGDGEWQQIGQTLLLTVTAPMGSPELTVLAPQSLAVSQCPTVTVICDFGETDGYTECGIYTLSGTYYDLKTVSDTVDGSVRTVTYRTYEPVQEFGPHFITVYAVPNGVGYTTAEYRSVLDVTGGTLNASLTADPNPADIFEDVHISLRVPGATAVALYGSINGMEWSYAEGELLEDDQPMWEDGEAIFCGRYTTEAVDPTQPDFRWEDVHWTGMAETVRLTVNPPSHTLEALDAVLDADSVQRGDRLTVTIRNRNPGLDVSYGACLQPTDGSGGGSAWYGPDTEGSKTILVETAEVQPGEYRLLISASAISCLPVTAWLPVTVTAADDGPHFSLPAGDVLTADTARVTGFANGASHIRMDVSFENGTWRQSPAFFEADGDCLQASIFTGGHPDTIVLDLTVSYPDGTSDTLTGRIPVTAPNGPVHPAISLNSVWQPGQDLDFTVTVEAGAQYDVFVQEPDGDEAVFACHISAGTPENRFILSADDYGFDAGKAYEIRVAASGSGYDGREAAILFTRRTDLTTLTLPASLTAIGEEAFAGVAAEKIVVPSGVTAIGSGAFSGCPNLVELELPDGITSFAPDALGTSGPVFVYGLPGSAQETYAETVSGLVFVPIS